MFQFSRTWFFTDFSSCRSTLPRQKWGEHWTEAPLWTENLQPSSTSCNLHCTSEAANSLHICVSRCDVCRSQMDTKQVNTQMYMRGTHLLFKSVLLTVNLTERRPNSLFMYGFCVVSGGTSLHSQHGAVATIGE